MKFGVAFAMCIPTSFRPWILFISSSINLFKFLATILGRFLFTKRGFGASFFSLWASFLFLKALISICYCG
ncbi:unnamed protein product [Moneuplotes crassus]|uniref:Uncharacterized protein n=1 Tax=Euplotes crassus TaxID=5936 RepID=A0AAD2DAA9_EUPCR|nr:unnamed protein product [Moneuplotes crassus]